MDLSSKIFTNRRISDEELDIVKSIFEDKSFNDLLKTHFIYIYFDNKGYIRFLSVDNDSVKKVCDSYGLRKKEAVEYIYMKDDIEQEIGEMLYWLDIDDYKKYVPVVDIMKDGEREYAEYVLFAKNEVDAAEHLYRNGYFDYMFLEDVDA